MKRIFDNRLTTLILVLLIVAETVVLSVFIRNSHKTEAGQPEIPVVDTTVSTGDTDKEVIGDPESPLSDIVGSFFPGNGQPAGMTRKTGSDPVAVDRTMEPPVSGRVEWIMFIGSITEDSGGESYYFKDARTSRVRKIAPGATEADWLLSAVHKDYFVIVINGVEYEVNR